MSSIRDSKFSRFASRDTSGILTNSALQQQLSLLNKTCISWIFSTKEIRTAMANLQCKSVALTDFCKRILIKKSFTLSTLLIKRHFLLHITESLMGWRNVSLKPLDFSWCITSPNSQCFWSASDLKSRNLLYREESCSKINFFLSL